MADCPTPNPNCDAPIGSPAPDNPCDPCFASDPKDMFALVKSLSAEVCALQTRMSNLYQLFGRTRNRLSIVEDTVNNLPDDEEASAAVGCGGLEVTSEADAVLVCEDGSEKAFVAGGVPEHIVFCGGKAKKVAKGLQFYPLTTKQLLVAQSNSASNVATVTLPNYPTDVCGPVWGVFHTVAQAFTGVSSSGTSVQAFVGGYPLVHSGFFGDYAFSESSAPTPSSSLSITITTSGSGAQNISITLIGYMY